MTAKDEMSMLLNDAIEMASHLIQKHGTHIPFAMAIDAQNERIDIAVDDTSMPSVDQLINDLLKAVRQGCDDKKYRVIAYANNVNYKSASDSADVDAIQITIDHIDDAAITCYLPYTFGSDQAFQPGELFATEPQLTFFDTSQ